MSTRKYWSFVNDSRRHYGSNGLIYISLGDVFAIQSYSLFCFVKYGPEIIYLSVVIK